METGLIHIYYGDGKGKTSAYIFGMINSILYGIIAYKSTYYGETMLNILYYFPMQFVGLIVWKRNTNTETNTINKRHMKNKQRLFMLALTAAATYLYGLILKHLGDSMPFIDSFTTIASVIAMVITIKMYSEQWWIWLAVNSMSIYMWATDFLSGSDNIATLIMWLLYLINGIIILIKWEREIKRG